MTNSAQHELTKTVTTVYGACVYTTRLLARTTQYFFFFSNVAVIRGFVENAPMTTLLSKWRASPAKVITEAERLSCFFSCFDIETNIGQRGNRLMCLHEGFAGGAKSRRQKCSHQTTQCERQENEG